MLTDVTALALSLFAIWFTRRPATPEKTYGYFRVEILAALVNGVGLVLLAFFIIIRSFSEILRTRGSKGRPDADGGELGICGKSGVCLGS